MRQTTSGTIYAPANWFVPLRWEELFARPQPVEVDLGCGKGSFLAWAAQSRRDVNFLGVDRLRGRLRKAAGKIERAGLKNVRLLRIEGGYFVEHLAPAYSVAAYHIYFPDPWPKRRHHPRRLFGEQFVRNIRRTLVPRGAVNIATDDADYAESIRVVMSASGLFTAETSIILPVEGQTDFERQFHAAGTPIYRARWIAH